MVENSSLCFPCVLEDFRRSLAAFWAGQNMASLSLKAQEWFRLLWCFPWFSGQLWVRGTGGCVQIRGSRGWQSDRFHECQRAGRVNLLSLKVCPWCPRDSESSGSLLFSLGRGSPSQHRRSDFSSISVFVSSANFCNDCAGRGENSQSFPTHQYLIRRSTQVFL